MKLHRTLIMVMLGVRSSACDSAMNKRKLVVDDHYKSLLCRTAVHDVHVSSLCKKCKQKRISECKQDILMSEP